MRSVVFVLSGGSVMVAALKSISDQRSAPISIFLDAHKISNRIASP
jgi:hypothetical protein